MDSADKLVIEIDGRELAVIDGRLAAIENDNKEIHAELREMHTELRNMIEEVHMIGVRVQGIEARIDDMKFYVSLSFGALAVFVAGIALVPIIVKIIQVLRKHVDEDRMRLIFREEYEKLKTDSKPI